MIAPAIGLSEEEADQIAQYLVDEGLLRWAAFAGVIEMTHFGIKEVEQARTQPDKPTVHFPAFNVIHVEHMTQSQIQQATVGSVQQMTQTVTSDEASALREFLAVVKEQARELQFEADVAAKLEAQVATLESQMKSANPKRSILKEAGKSVLEILASAPGRAAVEEVLKHVPEWLHH